MKNISALVSVLALAATIAVVSGGVLEAGPEIQEEARRLWRTYCEGGRGEGNSDPRTTVYCKIGTKARDEDSQYEINVTPSPTGPKQVVFVQAPPVNFKHRIYLRGGAAGAQETKIFVAPGKQTHTYVHEDRREGTNSGAKPKLYFLPSNVLGGGGGSGGSSGGNQGSGGFGGFGGRDSPSSSYGEPQIIAVGGRDNAQGGGGRSLLPGPGPTYLPPRNQQYFAPQEQFRG